MTMKERLGASLYDDMNVISSTFISDDDVHIR